MKMKTLFFILLLVAVVASAQTDLQVRYRSAETVYLNAGKAAGVDVGDRLQVLRGGSVIAEVEVIFAAEHSASCRIVSERQTVQAGDRARRLGETSPEPRSEQSPPAPAPEPQPPAQLPQSSSRGYGLSRTGLAGTVSVDHESFSDGSEAGRDFQRTAVRLNLRARGIAGTPLQARLRLRTSDEQRTRRLFGIPERESRDRLYELALIYEPPEGRAGFRLGRLGTSPFAGIGYLDGALAQTRIVRGVEVGGFYGLNPDIEELGFENSGSKYGVFTRFGPASEEARDRFEVLLAGIREEGDVDISREYVTLESRYDAGSRWSFFQHAELDLNRGWREQAAGSGSQLSTVALTAIGRLSAEGRLVLSYDRFERYWTEETRFIPVELFEDFIRQGLRVSWQRSPAQGFQWSVSAGARLGEEGGASTGSAALDADRAFSLGLGAGHSGVLGLSLGADVMGFTNPVTDGLLVTARAGRTFGAGHALTLSVGTTLYRESEIEEERSTQWGRASLWLELPLDLFGRAEVEVATGDDLEGQRLSLGLGYRF